MMMTTTTTTKNSFNLSEFLELVSKKTDFLEVFSLISENESNYKETEFYKKNRIKLKDLVFDYKRWSTMSFFSLEGIQEVLDNLDLDNIAELIDGFSDAMYRDSQTLVSELGQVSDMLKLSGLTTK